MARIFGCFARGERPRDCHTVKHRYEFPPSDVNCHLPHLQWGHAQRNARNNITLQDRVLWPTSQFTGRPRECPQVAHCVILLRRNNSPAIGGRADLS